MATTTRKTTRRRSAVGKSKGLNSPSARAYRSLQSTKKKFCAGKVTATAVNTAASKYVTAAVKAGKTQAAAQKTANRVKKGGCSMSSSVAGRRKRATARRKRA